MPADQLLESTIPNPRTPVRRFPVVDKSLPHQGTLHFWSSSKQEVVMKCNCGWVGTPRRPEVEATLHAQIAEYEGHEVEARLAP